MVISKKRSSLEFSLIFFNFRPKSKVFSKNKERSLPKFGNYFLQLIIVTALKFLTLPKVFISLPKKFWFCPNIFLSLPEKFQFCPSLRNLGGNCPPAPRRVRPCFPVNNFTINEKVPNRTKQNTNLTIKSRNAKRKVGISVQLHKESS